jgi:hypothetical protein
MTTKARNGHFVDKNGRTVDAVSKPMCGIRLQADYGRLTPAATVFENSTSVYSTERDQLAIAAMNRSIAPHR